MFLCLLIHLVSPTYMNLIRHFWVRAHVYDRKAAKLEETEKILIDPILEGKSRKEMGLEPFTITEIRSSIMGIPVFISQDNSKNNPWNEVVNKSMFNSKKKGAYNDLSIEKKLLLKIQNQNLLSKGGCADQPSLEHRVFLHYFITKEKSNMPKYILMEVFPTKEKANMPKSDGRLSTHLHEGSSGSQSKLHNESI